MTWFRQISARADQSIFRFLVAVATGLLGAAVIAIGMTVWWLRSDAIGDATNDTGNLATVLAEQTNLAVQSIDLVLNEIQVRLENLGATTDENYRHLEQDKNTYHALLDSLSHLSQAGLIALIDRSGRVLVTTQKWPSPGVDVSDRDYFQHFKNDDDKGIFVGKPVADRTRGLQTIFFGKRINDASNAFLGMILVGVRVTYFQAIYNSITSLPDQSFLLLRADGTVILRYPDPQNRSGDVIPTGSPWYRLVSKGGGTYRSPGYFDDIARLVAVRPLARYPLVTDVAISEAAALAGWRNHALTIGIGTLLVIICSVFLLRALINHTNRLVSSEAALAKEQAKVDVALRSMLQGLVMFDSSARLVICNRRYLDMYGLSPEVVKPGCPLSDLLNYRVATGMFFTDDPQQYINELLAAARQGTSVRKVTTLRDGRIVQITNQPVAGGGWVAIHEDVTDMVKAENAKEEQQRQRDAALSNMSQGLALFDASAKLVICNQRYLNMYCLPPQIVKPGCPFCDIIAWRIKNDSFFTADIETFISDLRDKLNRGTTVRKYATLRDGRIISIVDHPTADGGWVTTHEDVTELRRAEERISYAAHHDALTDLANRTQFREKLDQALKRVARGEHFAVLYLDLDNFKIINDTLGHLGGDELLKEVAGRLQGCVRNLDTLARLGGDEFGIIQAAVKRPPDVAYLAMRIQEALKEPYDIGGHRFIVGTSIGVAMSPDNGVEAEQLLKNADLAMYQAKANGRGTFCFFEPEMDARVKARSALEFELRQAIMCDQFELYYQPFINLRDGAITGCEALLRWHHPERGMVSPAEFIPIAEETGLIDQLGEWALRTACTEAATWPDGIKISVNVSPVQFKNPAQVLTVVGALAASGLPARRLELEITETAIIHNEEATLGKIAQLREMGVQISLDDFGTGYSSLRYLQRIPFDKIKIDRSFIENIASDDNSLAIVQAVITVAKARNVVTVAEGVETEQQKDMLRILGCSEMQGYLFSRPVPVQDLSQFFPTGAQRAADPATAA
jgi:diguanylate cyclase (GGDEF)-like protein